MAWTLSRATGRRTSWTWTVSPGTRASRMRPFSWRATFTTRRSAPSKEGPHRAGAEGIRETFTDEESGHYAHQPKHPSTTNSPAASHTVHDHGWQPIYGD